MNKPKTAAPLTRPITEHDVPMVGLFLHQHMNSKFSSEAWANALKASWLEKPPNYGFMLEAPEGVVGAICALYSEQSIAGEVVRVCNPHSWCVLEPYRKKSVSLVLSLIRQDGYHFTMFSPNKDGEEIFSYLGFKPLERDMTTLVNMPLPRLRRDVQVTSDPTLGLQMLHAADRQCVTDHREFEWLNFLFYRHKDDAGFLIYKKDRYKRLPCARIVHVSDNKLLRATWRAVRTHLLIRGGMFTTKVEQRLLGERFPLGFETAPASAKFYLSERLSPVDINYTYSELVALDL